VSENLVRHEDAKRRATWRAQGTAVETDLPHVNTEAAAPLAMPCS